MSAAATSPAPSPQRRKINNNNNNSYNTSLHDLNLSPSSFVDQFKSINSDSPETAALTVEERFSSPDSSPVFSCSTNGSFGLYQHRMINFSNIEVDSFQVETSTCNSGDELRRYQMSLSSEARTKSQKVESMEKPTTQANYRHAVSMPKEYELEEFFTTVEKDIKKRFSDKYNYDIVKDVPLEGRYEWVQLKP